MNQYKHSLIKLWHFHRCSDEGIPLERQQYDQETERRRTNLSQGAIIIDKPDEPAQPLFPRGQLACEIMVRPDDFSV